MKTLRLTLLSSLVVTATAVPALACEYHDGGGWFMPGSQWRNFTPKASTLDPAMMDSAMMNGDEDIVTVPAPRARPAIERKRPSFSSAADRANRAARTKVLMMSGDASDARSAAAAQDEADAKPASKADTQTVR